jgi:hypothetical protein
VVAEAQIESQQAAPCCFMFTFSAQASKEQLNLPFLLREFEHVPHPLASTLAIVHVHLVERILILGVEGRRDPQKGGDLEHGPADERRRHRIAILGAAREQRLIRAPPALGNRNWEQLAVRYMCGTTAAPHRGPHKCFFGEAILMMELAKRHACSFSMPPLLGVTFERPEN